MAEGEAVVTSGLQQGLFPPQIPVGRVRGAKITPGQLEQEVTIEPVVDLDRLELVRILIWEPAAFAVGRPTSGSPERPSLGGMPWLPCLRGP